ncbi:pentatricopeptide repeat-containing protein [Tanacetum coccineum]|uniref:Pentatricopeptide repeat-containing protein n=1 Tax=Tanacetum coccineum TaxID=301880 RepID=A0ABQ4Y8M6_9ASTR
MKEKGFVESPVTYNDIMCLYIRSNNTNYKVLDVLKEMKKNGVKPDNLSYRMCINSYGYGVKPCLNPYFDRGEIEGMEKVLSEMEKDSNIVMDWNTYAVVASIYIKKKFADRANNALKKAEKLVEKDGLGYNHLISLHARLRNKKDVLRLWGLQKTACKRQINRDYTTMVKSLVRNEQFEEAEKLLVEWKSSGNVYDFHVPLILIDGYLEKKLPDKAKDLLDNLVKERKATTPDIWGLVADSFLKKGDVGKALSCMEIAFSLPLEKKDWKLDSKTVYKLLKGFGEKASVNEVHDVKLFVLELRRFVKVDRETHYTFMKAYINSDKDPDFLYSYMKAFGIVEDEETRNILNGSMKK